MPVACRDRKKALPNARWRAGIRGPKGGTQRQLQARPLHRRGDRLPCVAEEDNSHFETSVDVGMSPLCRGHLSRGLGVTTAGPGTPSPPRTAAGAVFRLAFSLPMAFWAAEREDHLRALVADGKTAREIALEIGCSRSTAGPNGPSCTLVAWPCYALPTSTRLLYGGTAKAGENRPDRRARAAV